MVNDFDWAPLNVYLSSSKVQTVIVNDLLWLWVTTNKTEKNLASLVYMTLPKQKQTKKGQFSIYGTKLWHSSYLAAFQIQTLAAE